MGSCFTKSEEVIKNDIVPIEQKIISALTPIISQIVQNDLPNTRAEINYCDKQQTHSS